MGITRDSVITLAKWLGIEVREQALPREMLYVADEAFFTGTAAEITPIRSVDRVQMGRGEPGGVTRSLQRAFFGLFTGETRDRWGWLDPVEEAQVHVMNGTASHGGGGTNGTSRAKRTTRARWPTEPCPW